MLTKEHFNEPAVLSSWKEVAAYLGKGVRTVQRWERFDQLPVRRLSGTSRIIVHREEIDLWLRSRAIRSAASELIRTRQDLDAQNLELIASARRLRASHSALRQTINGSLAALVAECRRLNDTCSSMVRQSASPGEPPRASTRK